MYFCNKIKTKIKFLLSFSILLLLNLHLPHQATAQQQPKYDFYDSGFFWDFPDSIKLLKSHKVVDKADFIFEGEIEKGSAHTFFLNGNANFEYFSFRINISHVYKGNLKEGSLEIIQNEIEYDSFTNTFYDPRGLKDAGPFWSFGGGKQVFFCKKSTVQSPIQEQLRLDNVGSYEVLKGGFAPIIARFNIEDGLPQMDGLAGMHFENMEAVRAFLKGHKNIIMPE